MNHRFVIGQFGLLMLVMAGFTFVVACLGGVLWNQSPSERLAILAMVITFAFTLAVGAACRLYDRRQPALDFIGRREALLLVGLTWFVGTAVLALPFYLWAILHGDGQPHHIFRSFAACYFEAASGLTTTGATVLSELDTMPRTILLWRALSHWLGGIGIVVLFVAVLPGLGAGGKRLFQLENTGQDKTGVRPRIADTARQLWLIYLGITVLGAVLLRATGAMDWFEAICHTFSMVSTGGFSTRDASIAGFDSLAVDLICCLFMFAAGINFVIFYQAFRGRWKVVSANSELRVFFFMHLVVMGIVTLNMVGQPIITTAGQTLEAGLGNALRYASFQTISLNTGTGFTTADYDRWPFLAKALILMLMFIGGCAGSTAGGIKVVRVWIVAKVLLNSIEQAFRPNVVRPVKIGRSAIDPEAKIGALAYFLVILLLFGIGAVLLKVFEPAGAIDITTALSASLATLCNVGPGFHGVGPTFNYAFFSNPSLLLMSLLMLLGRLEVFAIAVLFLPRFWKQD
jgi:trk system potassium uptake protein TrkH